VSIVHIKNKKGETLNFLFILPAVLLNLMFFIWPFVRALYMSFYDWSLMGNKKFIGLGNFIEAFHDEKFINSLIFTLKYAVIVTPCLFIVAFALALLVNQNFKGVTIFRTIYFAPVVISMTTCSLVWLWIYNDLYGVLNYILDKLGIISENILWMNSADTSLPAIVFMITWKMAGFTMLILIGAFQTIDEEVYEAASIDGASKIQKFTRITLPMIKSYIALAMIISVIGSVLAFEQFSIMTKGGPSSSTTTTVHYIYNTSFKYFHFGYGSAISMILLVILLGLSYFQMAALKDPTDN